MKLSALLNRRVELSIPVEGGDLKFAHNPSVYTPAFQEQIRSLRGEDDAETAINFYCQALPKLIIDWDLEDENGRAMPVTEATVRQIPLDVLNTMLEAITASQRPFETEKTPGSTGSFS